MTRKHVFWLVGVGAAAMAALVVVHLLLPIAQTWAVNRLVHYAWEGAAGLAAVGGGVWLMWPRPKARRRDEQRTEAHRRLVALAAVVLAAVVLVVFGEMHRDLASRGRLEGAAVADLEAIGKALAAYEADHAGARPASIADLAPKYLDPGRLYYVFRAGPVASDPPPAPLAEGAEPPSYALVKVTPVPDARKRQEPRFLAYLRPGHAWAPLTAVLEKDGTAHAAGEDEVRLFETRPATPP